MLNPESGYYDTDDDVSPLQMMEYAFADSKQEKYRIQKWVVNHLMNTPHSTHELDKIAFLSIRSNAYVDAKDYIGAMFCTIAATPVRTCRSNTLHNMEFFFTKQYGPDKGREYYRRYLECIVSEAPGTDTKNELARLTKASPQNAATPQASPPPNAAQPSGQNDKKH